jgi:hypothetical protein
MTLQEAEHITRHLEQLAITDETFSEYILQILEDDMDNEEKIEIIAEFLVEASDTSLEEEKLWVQELLELQRQRKEAESKELEQKQQSPPTMGSKITMETRESRQTSKPELTREQKMEREMFLRKYGYEVYETEEVNGEVEFVGGLKKERKDDILNIRELNVSAVKDKENKRKQDMQQKHQKEAQRNKEMQEKQRLEREIKKKGTQKREKVRG